MKKNSLFSFAMILTLVMVAAFTINQVVAANRLVSAASSDGTAPNHLLAGAPCSASDLDRSSIHVVYVEQFGAWMPSTNNGSIGMDGGLLELLSDRRTCAP